MMNVRLNRFEIWFQRWMHLLCVSFLVTAIFFLVCGGSLPRWLDTAGKETSILAPYPASSHGEGAFWRILAVSMMCMLTWSCRRIYSDPGKNRSWVTLVLISKLVSSFLYLVFFLFTFQVPYLVGWITDGALFLITLALWIPASTGIHVLTETERDILATLGDTLVPRGGAFQDGYKDHASISLDRAEDLISAQPKLTQIVSRLLLHLMDISPIITCISFRRMRNLPLTARSRVMDRMETHKIHWFRWVVFAAKLYALGPLYSLPEVQINLGLASENSSHEATSHPEL